MALLTKNEIYHSLKKFFKRTNDEFILLVVVTDEVDIAGAVVVVGPIDSWSVLNDSVGRKHPQSQVQSTDGRSINLQKIFCFRVKIKPNFSARGDQKSLFFGGS